VRGTGGGPEKTILHGAALAAPDIHVIVCYIRDRRDKVFSLGERAAALGVRYLEVEEKHSFDRGAWNALQDVIRTNHIDIVHAHEYKTDFLALRLASRTGVIPLSTVHGWSGYSWRERKVYYPIDKLLLKRFPHVIVVSSPIRDELIRRGVRPERITLLLNSIDVARFVRDERTVPDARRTFGWPDGAFVFGGVGRLEIEKRYDVLIDAFAKVRSMHPQAHLAFAGDGSLKDSLMAQAASLGVADACSFPGQIADVIPFYHAIDAFVQSSQTEGTPNAVLEAMALGTPVVATDVGGTRDLITTDVHGLIVPSLNAAALADAMVRVIRDPAAARARTVAARTRIEQDLSFTARTRRMEDVYRRLVQEAQASHA
jgi:glycosyltransferase involved in cell wall biosynthesis